MTERTLAVVSAGLSQPSSTRLLADQLAATTGGELERRGVRPAIEVVELREHAHDVVNAMLTGFPPAGLKQALELVTSADGLIAVTPIFNASYSGLFKSFFDIVEGTALAEKPVLIAATGGSARHSLALEHALRPMFSYLHAVVVPTAVFAASEDWGDGSAQEGLARRIDRAAGELAALMAEREQAKAVDPFEEPTPFEQLLADGRP